MFVFVALKPNKVQNTDSANKIICCVYKSGCGTDVFQTSSWKQTQSCVHVCVTSCLLHILLAKRGPLCKSGPFWSPQLERTVWGLRQFSGLLVLVRVNGWIMYCLKESPHKGMNMSARVRVCNCLWLKRLNLWRYVEFPSFVLHRGFRCDQRNKHL